MMSEAEKIAPGVEDDTADETFPTRLDAWRYLQDSGWQISRSQFYDHVKQGRVPRKGGSYQRADVDRYAQIHCRLLETGEKVNDKLTKFAERKAEVELKREEKRLERETYELAVKTGKYVLREDVELMIVGRAVAMLSHLKAMVQMGVGDWIALAEGNQERCRELIDDIQQKIEEHLAIFAKDIEFEVIFEKNTTEDGNGSSDNDDRD